MTTFPTGRFRLTTRDVSLVDQVIVVQVGTGQHRNTNTAMHVKNLFFFNVRHATHIRQDTLCCRSGADRVGAAHENDELIPAKSSDDVIAPHAAAQLVRNLAN